MHSPKDYWNRRLQSVDIESYDFSAPNHPEYLTDYCHRYLKEGDPVLDLGCGGGRNARYLARAGYRVYGIDFSELAIDFCRKVFKKLELPGSFFHGDLDSVPLADNFFSGVICVAALDHVTLAKARKAISEIRRVLRPQGSMLLTFDPLDRVEIFKGKAEILDDGTMRFYSGEQAGMLFRQYRDEEIIDLLGQENLISFDKDDKGERIVVTC